MATSSLSATVNRRLLLAGVFVPSLWAKRRYQHKVLKFKVETPDGWNFEEAEVGVTLTPPGVKIDPEREDNPEVYTVWSPVDDRTTEQDYIATLRFQFRSGNVVLERGGDIEKFPISKRAPGVIYTFDFDHPERKMPYRIRVFAVQTKIRPLLLIAQGQRARIVARDRSLRDIAAALDW
jgi:hypothetical protein